MKKTTLVVLALIFLLAGASCRNEREAGTAAPGFSAEETAGAPETTKTCVVSIECTSVLNNLDKLKKGKEPFVPADGVILAPTVWEFETGDSAFDVLKNVCASHKCSAGCKYCENGGIQLEYSFNPGFGSYYAEGIHQLYEKDCGPRSGWTYRVNGTRPDVVYGSYRVKDSDRIEWIYECDYAF